MVFCELINERFITAICSEAFCANQIYMLYAFSFIHSAIPSSNSIPAIRNNFTLGIFWSVRMRTRCTCRGSVCTAFSAAAFSFFYNRHRMRSMAQY